MRRESTWSRILGEMALEITNLRVKIGNKEVLKGVDIRVEKGEVVALMGPNGSGKSSLAYAVAGHPNYKVIRAQGSELSMDGESLLDRTPDERARMGLFLALQYPVAISGVTVKEMLLASIRERKIDKSALELRKEVEKEAEELGVSEELLKRSINDGFSGGEKKKMEILQMRILKPKYAILDETDSGLDIDALRTVAKGARSMVGEFGTGMLVITHYQRILKYLKPDRVVILKDGVIVKEGDGKLVEELEKKGYKLLEK